MISVTSIRDNCNFLLDAEDSDRYLFDEHFKPAINMAQKWLVKLYNRLFGMKKVSEESLYELHYMRVFQASKYSRVSFPSTSDAGRVWTLTGVYPKITTIPASPTLAAPGNKSVYLETTSVDSVVKSATRITIEEVASIKRNPLLPGSDLITNQELIDYAYTNPVDYTGGYDAGEIIGDDDDPNLRKEITIYPSVAGLVVALSYLVLPEDIDSVDDAIPFPEALTELVVDKVLQLLSIKDDDGDSLYNITSSEIQKAIQLLS